MTGHKLRIAEYSECQDLNDLGTWIDSDSSDWSFKVRRVDSQAYLNDQLSIIRRLYGLDTTSVYQPEVDAIWLAEYGVVDWKNDSDIPYSRQNALNLFNNEENWLSLDRELINKARNYNYFLVKFSKEDAETVKKP